MRRIMAVLFLVGLAGCGGAGQPSVSSPVVATPNIEGTVSARLTESIPTAVPATHTPLPTETPRPLTIIEQMKAILPQKTPITVADAFSAMATVAARTTGTWAVPTGMTVPDLIMTIMPPGSTVTANDLLVGALAFGLSASAGQTPAPVVRPSPVPSATLSPICKVETVCQSGAVFVKAFPPERLAQINQFLAPKAGNNYLVIQQRRCSAGDI
jgi:hypothetical protein